MNKLEKIEAKNRIKELIETQNTLKAELAGITVENGADGLEQAKGIDKKIKANELEIIKIENSLKEFEQAKEKSKNMKNYLETQNAVVDMIEVIKNSDKKTVVKNWEEKLKANGVEIEGDAADSNYFVPRKLVEAIESSLLEANPVYKVFRVTNVGALLVNGTLESNDPKDANGFNRALVHKDGETKKEQSVIIKESKVEPIMVYKLQKIAERIKKLNVNFNEIWNMLVAEMTQAIVDKVVELALIEGKVDAKTSPEENGFTSIVEEAKLYEAKKRERIKGVTGTEQKGGDGTTVIVGAFQNGIEQALDFVRGKAGLRYLILTSAQRTKLLNELRSVHQSQVGFLSNSDAEIAKFVGVDELIVYTGYNETTLPPIIIRDKAYHVDMQDLTRIEAFVWQQNENALLIETLTAGHTDQIKAGAVITLPAP